MTFQPDDPNDKSLWWPRLLTANWGPKNFAVSRTINGREEYLRSRPRGRSPYGRMLTFTSEGAMRRAAKERSREANP